MTPLINTESHSRATINRRAQSTKPGEPGSPHEPSRFPGGFSPLRWLSPALERRAGADLSCLTTVLQLRVERMRSMVLLLQTDIAYDNRQVRLRYGYHSIFSLPHKCRTVIGKTGG